MSRRLAKIKPFHADLIPPQGSVPAGVTHDQQHQLFTLKRWRSRPVPMVEEVLGPGGTQIIDPATGEPKVRQVWRKNQMTGEPLYPVFRPERYEETLLFWLESQGNGNVAMTPYLPPTDDELAAVDRAKKIAEMKDALAEALVDAGKTPADLIAALRSGQTTMTVSEPETPAVTTINDQSYPVYMPPGRWQLSDGTVIKCRKDEALRAEEALQQAAQETHAAAEATPEF